MQVINRYKIASCVPLNGTKSFTDISQDSGLELDKCRRILRYAMTYHLFCEPQPERVAHTAMSSLLANDQESRDLISHMMEDVFPGGASEADAIAKWPNSNSPAQCGAALSNNLADGSSMFDFFRANPDRAQTFGGAMAFYSSEGTDWAAVAQVAYGFDWNGLGRALLVDVGGSRGHVSFVIAEVARELRFVVQDLSEVITPVASSPPPGLEGRLRFEVYDFRTPQPIKDADVYFFRRIFHDWPDDICLEILKNLVPSMKQGARVVLNENILPGPNDTHGAWETKLSCSVDMTMMVGLNSRERSLLDWKSLFENGSEGKLVFESGENSMLSWVRKGHGDGSAAH